MADNDPRVHHEEHDVNAKAITRFGIGLALTVMVSMFALWGLFIYYRNRAETALGPVPPTAGVGTQAAKLPPAPRLQESPVLDLEDMRAAEDQILDHYGWVDQQKGVVRIPIDRAMDILGQRGLPARAQAPPPAGSPNNPTQSGAGPILQQPGGPLAPQLGTAGGPGK
jgi:hypothetical protein